MCDFTFLFLRVLRFKLHGVVQNSPPFLFSFRVGFYFALISTTIAEWHQTKSILSRTMKILHLITLFLRMLVRSFVRLLALLFFHSVCWFFPSSVVVAILDIASRCRWYSNGGCTMWYAFERFVRWLFARLSHRCCWVSEWVHVGTVYLVYLLLIWHFVYNRKACANPNVSLSILYTDCIGTLE